MVAVPRLTSEGRELLIFSRVWPKIFGSTARNLLLLSILNILFFWSTLLHPALHNMPKWCLSVTRYMIALCLWLQQWRPDKKRCVCTAPPRLLRFTPGPLWSPLSEAKWSICPVCVPLKPTAAVYSTRRYLEPRDGHYIIYGCSWHSCGETTVNTEIKGHTGLCHVGPEFWTTEIKTLERHTCFQHL